MMKWMVAGLLSATAVVPAAWAQDASLRDVMRARMQARLDASGQRGSDAEARPERSLPAETAPARSGRDDRGERGDRSRPDRPQSNDAASPRPDRGDRGGWRRPDQPERPPVLDDRNRPTPASGGWARPDRTWPRDERNGGWRDGRDDRREPAANGGWRRGREDDGDGRTWRNDRSDRDWRSRRDDDGGWNNGRNWADQSRFDQRRGGWSDDRGRWSGDWRRDSRYDWNRYRSANRSAYRLPRYYAPYGWNAGYRRYAVGARLSQLLFARSYWIDDPWSYRLPDANGPYRWVRYYDDALLVDLDTGEVVDVIHDIFW